MTSLTLKDLVDIAQSEGLTANEFQLLAHIVTIKQGSTGIKRERLAQLLGKSNSTVGRIVYALKKRKLLITERVGFTYYLYKVLINDLSDSKLKERLYDKLATMTLLS